MNITERFLNYTQFDTQSAEESQTVPSTPKQLVFAKYLKEELEREGLAEVEMDEKGYIYATLPENLEGEQSLEASPTTQSLEASPTTQSLEASPTTQSLEALPTIGFISHYDTSPDCSGADIKPRIVKNYDGGAITLSEGIVMSPKTFPELLHHTGEDLIVTDGHTLLGADDKAGIAEIVQAMVYLKEHPELKHGRIRIAFNPDEEIGMGAHHFDVEKFGCQWAYTMDGGDVGELEYENFNAASAKITIKGVSVHPGYAKGKMVNASLVAAELVSMVPANERPETTEGYEGFYHLTGMATSTEQARLSFIIRDHDREKFEKRKRLMMQLADQLNEQYAAKGASVECEVKDQYYNMKEMVDPQRHVVDLALRAMQEAGVTPKVRPIRGGTDGAQLSFRGLPCPNIFAGGINFHGPFEFVPIQSMEKAMQVIVNICTLTAKQDS